jgi:hypothetical protein
MVNLFEIVVEKSEHLERGQIVVWMNQNTRDVEKYLTIPNNLNI